jgi:hypothetical protein
LNLEEETTKKKRREGLRAIIQKILLVLCFLILLLNALEQETKTKQKIKSSHKNDKPLCFF